MYLLLLAQSAEPTGLARGRWPASSWVVAIVGVVVVALAVAFLVLRTRRAKMPPSGAGGPGERP